MNFIIGFRKIYFFNVNISYRNCNERKPSENRTVLSNQSLTNLPFDNFALLK